MEQSGEGIHRVEDSPITVAAGERFTISLDVQATTGFVWQPIFSSSELILESDSFAAPGPGVGASGNQLLTFTPLKTGRSEIKLELRRSWEDRVLRTETVEIVVNAS